MAIYHLNIGHISRSTGRSAVQSAAYITGTKLQESRRELTADYRNRGRDVASTGTLAPEGSLAWAKDVSQIWDRLESFEDTYADTYYKTLETQEKYKKSARTALTIVVALPRGFSPEVNKELIEEFANARFVSRGLVVTYAIHKDEGNPHAHLLVSRRSVDENGDFSLKKDRDICKRSGFRVTRKLWADLMNHYLEREGFEDRVTEKSFADLGIMMLPTQHRGWMADKLEGKGFQSRIIFENREIILENRELLLENPALILDNLTMTKATFTQKDLLRTIQKRVEDDKVYVGQIFEGALQAAIVVGGGMERPDIRGDIRYTSQSYLEKEAQAVALTRQLAHQTYRQKISERQIAKALHRSNVSLNDEQQEAVRGLVGDQQLAVLVGWAGTGKTTVLKVVAELYQQTGHTVIGMSLAATASEELGTKAGVAASTLDSWLCRWRAYERAQEKFLSFDAIVSEGVLKQLEWYQDLKRYESSALTDKHVLLMDEAGMIGTEKWVELQRYAVKAGAKVIAIGDDSQCNPIDAGDFFRELLNQASQVGSFYHLKDIRRQAIPWMRDASVQLAQLNIQEGLSLYEKQGHLQTLDAETLSTRIAKDYVERIKQGKDGAVLASTHKQGALFNRAIRQELKQQGLIAQADAFTVDGKSFSIGDRLMFLKNDNERLISITNHWGVTPQNASSIKNGQQGVICEVRPCFDEVLGTSTQNNKGKTKAKGQQTPAKTIPQQPHSWLVKVEVADNRFAWFNTNDYDNITHAYTLTLQKAQGKTLDFALIYLSKFMDAMATYVGLTRHRDDIQLYHDQEEFKTFKALTSHLSRLEYKDLVKDYTILPENQEAHQQVQSYKEIGLDIASVLVEGEREGEVDWALYRELKGDQQRLGKEILADFAAHRLYIQQSGLTKESLQINVGLKARPLSRTEEVACKRVELYCETAQEARTVWNSIKTTPGGQRYIDHEQYQTFQTLRDQRDELAKEIISNESLHREFFKVISARFHYGKSVLYKQAAAYEEQQRGKHDERQKQHLPQSLSVEKESSFNLQKVSKSLLPIQQKTESNNTAIHNKNKIYQGNTQADNVRPKVDAAVIKEQLNQRIKELAFELLGKPTTQTTKEWRYGSKGSISIHVAGIKQGLYSNFEEGTHGNALKLIQDHFGLDHKQAFKWGSEWLGDAETFTKATPRLKPALSKGVQEEIWISLFPAPAEFPDLRKEKQLARMLYGKQETARFAYKDAQENILGYVVRLEDSRGVKTVPTLTYCRNEKGEEQWRWKGFGDDRSLYGLEQLAQKPEARVLIVEGEKTAEAAKALFPDYAVVTWAGGCGTVHKSDWSVLKGREVIIWPDNDKPGLNAADKIVDVLKTHGIEKAPIVDLPSTLPYKWDLADPLPEGVDLERLLETALSHDRKALSLAEQREPRYQKTFTYDEIYSHTKLHESSHGDSFLLLETQAPFVKHIANEAYKELKEWYAVTNTQVPDHKIQEQAAFTSFYTAHVKEFLEQENDPNALEKALSIGTIAGKLRMRPSFKDDPTCLRLAADHYQKMEASIQNDITMTSPLLKQSSQTIKEEVIRAGHQCHAATDQNLSAETFREFIKGLEQTCPFETNNRIVSSVLHKMKEIKAGNRNPLIPDLLSHALDSQSHQEKLLTKALQRSKDKILQEKPKLRYAKTFTYKEIQTHANQHRNSYLISESNAPFLEHLANEAYKELKEWHTITETQAPEHKIQLQAVFTSIYTSRFKELLEKEKDPNFLEKAHIMGAIAAKSKLEGEHPRNENDYLIQARATFQEQEEYVRMTTTYPPPLINSLSETLQIEVLKTALKCRTVTGCALPSDLLQHCVHILEHHCSSDRGHQRGRSILDHVRTQAAKGVKDLEHLDFGKIEAQHKQNELHLQKAIQLSHQKLLELQHQRGRDFEITL